jgi:ABC-type transport system involved in cytochrome c biogenesis permease subunit
MSRRLPLVACGVLAWLWAGTGGADEAVPLPETALRAVRTLAIQHNGRVKPFDSFARETLWTITGRQRFEGRDPVDTVLSIMADAEHWESVPLIAVPFVPLREPLGLAPKTSRVSYAHLVSTRTLMRRLPPIVAKQEQDEKLTMLENETMDAFQRFVALSLLLEQKLELVPPASGTGSWLPIFEPAGHSSAAQQAFRESWTALTAGARRRDAQAMDAAARRLEGLLRQANPAAYPPRGRLALEVAYHRWQPFAIARLLYALAVVGLWAGLARSTRRLQSFGLAACVAGFAVHAAGIAMRVILGGRPPVSNFFETMLWLPFVAVAVALILERIYRAGYLALAAAVVAAVTLMLTDYVPLDPSIAPVVAVLRSNLWLTVHVLTIVASYGALALAAVLAHVYGALFLARGGSTAALERLDLLLYRAIQVGVVLLAGGIMLGAVWANASWGRYWGWDPKETWALITLLWFLALLHGRFAGWLQGIGIALCTIGGFFLLLMTYYGVSFYLVGLHSYAGGHAKPLPPLLIGYALAEVLFLGVVGAGAFVRRSRFD